MNCGKTDTHRINTKTKTMFNTFYSFNYRNKEKPNFSTEKYDYVHRLTFTSKYNQKYIVRVEEYEKQSLYAVKFYLKNHSLAENKYSISTNFGDAAVIVRTCIEIMLYFHKHKNPLASFVFIGATDSKETSDTNTKRFRVYKSIMEFHLTPKYFRHFAFEVQSLYLMLNIKQNNEILEQIEAILKAEMKP
jgi:hypothetical protein